MTKGFVRHLLRARAEPADAFLALCRDSPYALWLDNHGERGASVSYIAVAEPIALTSRWREEVREARKALALEPGVGLDGVPLGVHLVLPYELAQETLGVKLPTHGAMTPYALSVSRVVEIDHRSGAVTACALVTPGDDLTSWIDELERALEAATPARLPQLPTLTEATWRDSEDRYRDMIAESQDFIAQGDAYQLCVTTSVSLDAGVDPCALHRVMRETNPTHHQALMRLGDVSLVSASPETFVVLTADGAITTRPIKGTRPRGGEPIEDARLAAELLGSDKERAENLMIVDLMRNDLSRVCETGSVHVPELLQVESYATVHQLVSTVSGQVRAELDLVDVLDAVFPAGSMTGAPKKRAVEILATLEGQPRGLYAGTYGVWRADGSAEFAMTIRTALIEGNRVTLGVGGGITALSEPDSEIREVGVKAQAFLRALGLEQVGYS